MPQQPTSPPCRPTATHACPARHSGAGGIRGRAQAPTTFSTTFFISPLSSFLISSGMELPPTPASSAPDRYASASCTRFTFSCARAVPEVKQGVGSQPQTEHVNALLE